MKRRRDVEFIGSDLKRIVTVITGETTEIGQGIALRVVPTSEPGTESRIQETVRELEALGVQLDDSL